MGFSQKTHRPAILARPSAPRFCDILEVLLFFT